MNMNGQLSRITSPISLVIHPLIHSPSAPGQFNLAQVHQARYFMDQTPRKELLVIGEVSIAEKAKRGLKAGFAELGYPHVCSVNWTKQGEGITIFESLDLASSSLVDVVAAGVTRCTGRPAPLLVYWLRRRIFGNYGIFCIGHIT
jgi:hypothetical protein